MAALLFVTLEEVLDNFYEDTYMLLNNDDRDIDIFAAVSAFMRRNLERNQDFYEAIIPLYSLDEFRCHFRMSRGTVELLCREIAGTRLIPPGNRFGRAAIPLEKQVLTFIWFISNKEVMRSVSDRFNVTLSSLERILFRVSRACVDLKQQYIKWPSGNEMHTIMNNFTNRGFPRIIGVIDGTHIRIRAPTKDPVAYINRKKFHSLNTQVVCDDNMIFRDVLVGWPAATKFPGDTHLIGDGGYPLKW
ncbi:Hypothetical predicted protein [Paramuricea clavata]|uniref:Putative nuclease HARBI1 n=1 Tax=Paramuricea clavata TaxID=317549 RepID=A0A7D9EYA3_PARCT|nr:Hypothetical predicted protein [Paramuricea clavata]